jgi:hypothetical protein
MNPEHVAVMQECAMLSLAGQITFLEVVRRLADIGVERYHADYIRHEITYYLPDGDSLVVTLPPHPQAAAETFSAAGIESAIRLIPARRNCVPPTCPENDGGWVRWVFRADHRPLRPVFRTQRRGSLGAVPLQALTEMKSLLDNFSWLP